MSDKKQTSGNVPAGNGGDNRKYIKQETWVSVGAGTVLSFMPGTVSEINVKEGDKVKKGDLLMVFRAMKMNNKILSPIDGVVKNINVEKGQNLPKNHIMVEVA